MKMIGYRPAYMPSGDNFPDEPVFTTKEAAWTYIHDKHCHCPYNPGKDFCESCEAEWDVDEVDIYSTGKEFCICAAVKSTTGRIIRGHRHGDCFKAILARGMKPSSSQDDQGFITSRNRYVTREEGRKLQDAASIPSANVKEGYMPGTLFSEDLY